MVFLTHITKNLNVINITQGRNQMQSSRILFINIDSVMFLTYFFLIWCKPLIDNYKLSVAMLSSEKAYILNVYNQSLWDKCILRFLFEMFINRFFFPSIFFQSGREICMLAWLQITGLYNFGHFLAEKSGTSLVCSSWGNTL